MMLLLLNNNEAVKLLLLNGEAPSIERLATILDRIESSK
ncbi:hypothetical protein V6Z12_A03G059400 [Gossypium hirsutum]